MKNALILFLSLILLFSAVATTTGQTKQKAPANLNRTVNSYIALATKAANSDRRRGAMRYAFTKKNTFYSDIDGDGDFDAITELFFCERQSCHPTTNFSKLAVFLNNRGVYRLAADRRFILFGKINSIENKIISVDVYDLDEDDPQCCPELKRNESYRLRGNKLVKVK